MATKPAKKTAAKKTAAKSSKNKGPQTVEIPLSRVTKGTYRFDVAESDREAAPIQTVYIKHSGFDKEPTGVRITFEAL